MSDEEVEHSEEEMEAEEAPEEEEVEAEPAPKPKKDVPPPEEKEMTETEAAIMAAKKKHEEDEAARLKEYEEQRKIQKAKEEEELAALKEKQERRRKEREEEEAMMAERMKAEEERRKEEEEARKKRIEADKAKKEAEKAKRQAMMQMQGAAPPAGGGGPNFVLPSQKQDKFEKLGNIMQAKGEMGLTKEQLEEQKRKMLAEHLKPLSLEGLDVAAIRAKVKELHDRVCKLEAETYDLEKRRERQDYDLKEMNERQRLINRNKALRKGLDPDAESSRFPPKIPVASKFERQVDRRSYGDRRDLFESPKHKPKPKLFHGSVRPPTEWGRTENEELEFIRKNLEPFKYVEQAPVEGAAPPMEAVPVSYDEGGGEDDEGGDEEEEE